MSIPQLYEKFVNLIMNPRITTYNIEQGSLIEIERNTPVAKDGIVKWETEKHLKK